MQSEACLITQVTYFNSTIVQQKMWIFKEELLFMMQVEGFAFLVTVI